MRRDDVTILIGELKKRYTDKYVAYGTFEQEEDGTGFRITDIPTTFSVLCFGATPIGRYDCQIESYPPGEYLYTVETDLSSLLALIEVYRRPMNEWPVNSK